MPPYVESWLGNSNEEVVVTLQEFADSLRGLTAEALKDISPTEASGVLSYMTFLVHQSLFNAEMDSDDEGVDDEGDP